MARTGHIEIERTYDVDANTEVPNLVGAGVIAATRGPRHIDMVAVYFDTEQLELAQHRVALRRRVGGPDQGWHVKQPAEEGRRETHWPLDDDPEHMPDDLQAWLTEHDLATHLVPIARIANTRVVLELMDAAGFAIAEFCDDHVSAEDLRRSVSSAWREWEVELQRAAPDSRSRRTALLEELERRVLDVGARPASSESKLQRTLGL